MFVLSAPNQLMQQKGRKIVEQVSVVDHEDNRFAVGCVHDRSDHGANQIQRLTASLVDPFGERP